MSGKSKLFVFIKYEKSIVLVSGFFISGMLKNILFHIARSHNTEKGSRYYVLL